MTAKHVAEPEQDALLAALERDPEGEAFEGPTFGDEGSPLAPADAAMLDYVARLTRRPWEVSEDDISRLREHGFDDRGIHDMCAVASYYAFVNRIADGLGVELEERW